MNSLASLRANVRFLKGKDGALIPEFEMIFLVANSAYEMNNQGDVIRSTELKDVRFDTSKDGLKKIMDLCKQLIEKEEKALAD